VSKKYDARLVGLPMCTAMTMYNTALFLTSHDSQGYRGGILTCLHTGTPVLILPHIYMLHNIDSLV
jgi:hypothetical protein